MHYKAARALGISLLLYIATFILGMAISFLSREQMGVATDVTESMWYVGMATSVILAAVFTYWYLRGSGLIPSVRCGLYFGLTAVMFSSIFDAAMFILAEYLGTPVDLVAYYLDPHFWIIVAIVIGTSALVGQLKRPR
jgi:hypothetical protein